MYTDNVCNLYYDVIRLQRCGKKIISQMSLQLNKTDTIEVYVQLYTDKSPDFYHQSLEA
jgi:hypothetical protein